MVLSLNVRVLKWLEAETDVLNLGPSGGRGFLLAMKSQPPRKAVMVSGKNKTV